MTHRRIDDHGLEYDFVPDDVQLLAHRHWVIARAQLLDDLAGTPLAVPFQVRVVLPGVQDEIAQDGSRAHRTERGITVKHGRDGTFALVAQPWLRFTPFGTPTSTTVVVEVEGYVTQEATFPIVYDQRTIAAPAPAADTHVVTLDSTAGLVAGQTLLFGPPTAPQYARIQTVGAGNQVTLEPGLAQGHAIGDAVFPDVFAAPAPVLLAVRREPVRVVGRVVRRHTATNVSTPVAAASVAVTDFWRTRAATIADPAHGSMTDPVPAQRQFAVSLAPGALASRAAGATTGSLALPVIVGDDRLLASPAADAGTQIRVDRVQNLMPPPAPLANRLLVIEPDDPDAAEYQSIATVDAAGTPDEPAELGLDLPLRRPHREGTRVGRINAPLALPPTPRTLKDATAPGDRCAFLDGLASLPPSGTLRLTGGGAPDEFQAYEQLAVQSDADGYFRLPLLQRVARVAITVDDGLGNVQTIEIDPQYGEPEARLDVVYFV